LTDAARPMALALPIFDPTLAETSVEGLARHVVRFLDALDLHRVVLGGNSLGGHVALHLALTEPERVAGLILTGSSGLFERTVTGRAPHRPSTEWIRARMEEVFYDSSLVTPVWVESVRRLLTERFTARRVLRFAQAARRHNIEARLGEIRGPPP
jgi:2-hydroxy-6-oxonona-2,4-dienedioate hydrolase